MMMKGPAVPARPMDELAAMEFMLDKMKNTRSNAECFNAMKR